MKWIENSDDTLRENKPRIAIPCQSLLDRLIRRYVAACEFRFTRCALGLYSRRLLVVLFVLSVPACASAASVQITEIMYDPPGANAGNQWIEVTNIGTQPVDLAGYKLSTGGVNHKLVLASGTTTLGASESAILASSPDNFSAQYPGYHGILFKSAFSLASKTGDTIILKDAKLAPLDTAVYTASAGASGDGNSLHRSGSTFVVGAPNPGSTAPTAPLAPAASAPGTSAKTVSAPTNAAKSNSTGAYAAQAANLAAANQAAPLLSQINLPEGPWAWALGGFGLFLLSTCAVWYLLLQTRTVQRNVLTADEFEIESE